MEKVEKNLFAKINWNFIWQQEGGLLQESCLPCKEGGVTIGPHFDLGKHTLAEIEALNLSSELKAKLKKWAAYRLGKARNAINDPILALEYSKIQVALRNFRKAKLKQLRAKRKLTLAKKQKAEVSFAQIEQEQAKQNLQKAKEALERAQKENSFYFKITREELNALVKAIIQVKEPQVIETYDQAVSKEIKSRPQVEEIKTLKPFAALPASVQTIIASFLYHRQESVEKTGTPEEKAFWKATVNQEIWTQVAQLLTKTHLNEESWKARRAQEADYLLKCLPTEDQQVMRLKTQEEMKYWKTHLKLEGEKKNFALSPSASFKCSS